MNTASRRGPGNHRDRARLLLSLQLTAEQREQIRERFGIGFRSLPYFTSAPSALFPFGEIVLRVRRGVFAPNRATETLLRLVLDGAASRRNPVIVDVGTGCGAVAIGVARALPRASIYATDISDRALECARDNRRRLGVRNVTFRRGSLLAPLPSRLAGTVSVIGGNLPYLPPRLAAATRALFPAGTAIGVGDDGLGLVRSLADSARSVLMPGGSLALQCAGFQWPAVSRTLRDFGYRLPRTARPRANAPFACRVVWPGAEPLDA